MTNRPIIENGIKYFKCKKCGEVKPLNKSYFYVNMNTRLGFISKCISCVKKEVENKPKAKYITRAELEEENRKLKEEVEVWKNANKKLRMHDAKMEYENKELKEEVEQLKNKRVFNSEEYDLITLTSTIPQWELRRK